MKYLAILGLLVLCGCDASTMTDKAMSVCREQGKYHVHIDWTYDTNNKWWDMTNMECTK